ncbi:cytochrome c [Roseibium sp. RKSG952]|uniref:cytochrome c n=1 Tax=Roseibium sp. RKSG952 TaxID=2529384 RepID=UPI0018AD1B46|nr:cytochrome c [Roseibium sp. RKSG952]
MRLLAGLVGLGVLGLVGYAGFAWIWGVPGAESRPTLTAETDIDAGRYLADMGDCAACHTGEGNVPSLAGGRSFDTPFGKLYSSNITPDKTYGIGNMTSAEFYQTMVYGADSVLAPLYPAMPYTSYHILTRQETDQIFAYLMSLEPVASQPPANALNFPFNIRPLMFGWNLLFASRAPFGPDPQKDAVWNRGKWISEGLGHCGECHTPRNILGAMEGGDKWFAGAVIGGFEAPNIQPGALAQRGWNREDLVTYFESGAGPQGSAFGEMFLAIKDSLRKLTHEDQVALATYLMDTASASPTKGQSIVSQLGAAAHANASGQALYLSHCALCHGDQGQGIPNAIPPLAGNSTVAQTNGFNLIAVTAKGLDAEDMSVMAGYGPMPGYRDKLTAPQLTDLANYIRAAFAPDTTQLQPLSQSEVETILKSVPVD